MSYEAPPEEMGSPPRSGLFNVPIDCDIVASCGVVSAGFAGHRQGVRRTARRHNPFVLHV